MLSPRSSAASATFDTAAPAVLAFMPQNCRAIWDEGLAHLRDNPKLQDAINKWRAWPAGTVRALAHDGFMGCPIVYGRRASAFIVQFPFVDELSLVSTRDVGLHVRHK